MEHCAVDMVPVSKVLVSFSKRYSSRRFYQDNVPEERGIEYDRLIELPEHIQNTGRIPQVINERERHLVGPCSDVLGPSQNLP